MQDDIVKIILENPVTAGASAAAGAAVVRFFKPIMSRLQAAFVRRIDQAWQDEPDDGNIEGRVRRTAERVRSQTVVPLPQGYVETRVRRVVSSTPPPSLPS
ncbi:MAG: hypothetical protein IH804_04255 [Planctomycetes bacterium]|nr:hypothetical protein [Planctomycetota bacterium]